MNSIDRKWRDERDLPESLDISEKAIDLAVRLANALGDLDALDAAMTLRVRLDSLRVRRSVEDGGGVVK